MIKFFRKIRQKLIADNRFSKYLIYAIGEILLVVIGILIALKLNNVNSQNIERNKEIVLLSEMVKNLEFDLKDLEWNIQDMEKKILSSEMVLNHLEGNEINKDSLSIFYANVKGSTVLIKNTSAFENLKSVGFDLIKNDSIRHLITRLYSEKYPYLYHLEVNYEQGFQMHHIYPQANSKIISPNSESNAQPVDYTSLQKDNLFKSTLEQNIHGKQFITAYQKETKDFILNLINLINEEITKG